MICDTGGVAVLAHPWALKNPVAIVRRLKEAGLHGMEVYRSDGKLTGWSNFIFAFSFSLSSSGIETLQFHRISFLSLYA